MYIVVDQVGGGELIKERLHPSWSDQEREDPEDLHIIDNYLFSPKCEANMVQY